MRNRPSSFGSVVEGEIARFLLRHRLDPAAGNIVVAFSGGPDSTALLAGLVAVVGPDDVVACHVDHHLHSASTQAAVDAEAIAVRIGCSVVTIDVVVPVGAAGVEASARAVRYATLLDVADALGSTVIAVGHTRDDRAETMILNLTRGSGLDGLTSMRPIRAAGDRTIIRPMLGLERHDVHAYVDSLGVVPVDDPTNADVRIARNKLRNEIVPMLGGLHPNAVANIARSITRLEVDRVYLDSQTDRAIAAEPTMIESGPGSVAPDWVAFDCHALDSFDPAIATRVIRRGIARLGEHRLVASAAVDQILEHKQGSLSGTGLTVRVEGGHVVVLGPARRERRTRAPIPVDIMAPLRFDAVDVVVGRAPRGELSVRYLSDGDRLAGAKRTMNDRLGRSGVPRRRRQDAIVLLADGEPICVAGVDFAVSDDPSVEFRLTATR